MAAVMVGAAAMVVVAGKVDMVEVAAAAAVMEAMTDGRGLHRGRRAGGEGTIVSK